MFTHTLSKLGIEVRYADPSDPKNFEKAIDEKTRAFYGAMPKKWVLDQRPHLVKYFLIVID